MTKLALHRAAAHRTFLGPEFGTGERDGDEPQGLSYAQIIGDEKLAVLGRSVFAELREQFTASAQSGDAETDAETEYRKKLEGWADMLEILLEETLTELDNIGAGRREAAEDGALLQ